MSGRWWFGLLMGLAACRGNDAVPPTTVAGGQAEVAVSDVAAPAPTPTAPPTAAPTAPTAPGPAGDAVPLEVGATERAAVERALADMKAGHEAWYGVYIMGKKAGHGRMSYRAAAPGEPGLVASEFEMEMAVTGGGNANTIRIFEVRSYGAEWPHPLVATRFEQNARGFVEVRLGTPAKDGMHITRKIDDKVEPERVGPVTRETLVDALRAAPLELDGLAYGKTTKAASWDWEREADETLTVTPEREETRKTAGVAEKVAIITVRYETSGVTATTIVGGSGEVLEMSLGAAVTMKLEEKDVAVSGVSGLDVLGSGIKSPSALGNPEVVERAVFELQTVGGLTLPSSAAQKVESAGPDRLKVTRVRGPGDAALPADIERALKADATMDAEHPAVKAQALALAQDGMSVDAKVKAIAGFVFRTLDKKLATHLPTASRVLEAKVGDCTEHTWLTVALLRAAGIPARPVYGVAYAGDGESSFAYHAWVEVAEDGHWIWIDPTWGEDVADATHLALGADLGGVAPSLGAITILSVTRWVD
ncbi:MAG: transglutaminase-like domain-containing protein [Myxococcota bacterium]